MKLKLRIIDGRRRSPKSYPFNLDDDDDNVRNYGQIHAAISAFLETDLHLIGVESFDLSLNYGKDILQADEETNLKDLGLVSGDVLTVLVHTDVSDVRCRSSNLDNNDYIPEIPVPATLASTCQAENGQATQNEISRNNGRIHRYFDDIVLCHESTSKAIPSTLERIYKNEAVTSIPDALVLVVHVLMGEVGFIQTCTATHPLLSTWKSEGEVYKLFYYHPIYPSTHCQLVCVSLGDTPMLVIHGIITNAPSKEWINFSLPCTDYVRKNPTTETEPKNVYHNLHDLSQCIKDRIACPLLKLIKTAAGIPINNELMGLPMEIKLFILSCLDARSLTKMSEVCVDLRQIADENSLWITHLLRDFPNSAAGLDKDYSGLPRKSWKELYNLAYLEDKKRRKREFPFLITPAVGMPLRVPPLAPFLPNPFGILLPQEYATPRVRARFREDRQREYFQLRRPRMTESLFQLAYGSFPRFI